MLDNQTQEESLNMSILVKNQTFGHQFRPFSDQFSQKGPNSDQVRPIRTKSGNTAKLGPRYILIHFESVPDGKIRWKENFPLVLESRMRTSSMEIF